MKNSTNTPRKTDRIKVRLDARTIILLHDMRSLEAWKVRYPEARIIR